MEFICLTTWGGGAPSMYPSQLSFAHVYRKLLKATKRTVARVGRGRQPARCRIVFVRHRTEPILPSSRPKTSSPVPVVETGAIPSSFVMRCLPLSYRSFLVNTEFQRITLVYSKPERNRKNKNLKSLKLCLIFTISKSANNHE